MANFQEKLTRHDCGPVMANSRTVFVETYGCQMNSYDSQAIEGLLQRSGFGVSTDVTTADIILLNTCSVRDLAEHKIVSRIGNLRYERLVNEQPQPVIGVCGCMAERLGKDLLKGKRKADLVVGVDNYDQLPMMLAELVEAKSPGKRVATGHRSETHYIAPPSLYPVNSSHLVTIHKGCDYKCTYCIVPYTRGPQTEKHPDDILTEIKHIISTGGSEVTLLGQNVTAYKWGDDLDFAALLELVAQEPGLKRIRFLTGHPRDMHPHLMDVIGRLEKVCPWLHLPAQSGSNRVLRRMKRLYTKEDYIEMVDYARKVIPGVTFSSDFIVGFPGETEEDFQDTLELIRQVKYDQIFTFKYSERPGAPAANLADDISVDEKKRRLAELIAVHEEVWNTTAEDCVGKVWDAVVETKARHPEGAWRLRTGNNRKIIVEADNLALGDKVQARITGRRSSTFMGEFLARTAGKEEV